jgi:hypothetical protein
VTKGTCEFLGEAHIATKNQGPQIVADGCRQASQSIRKLAKTIQSLSHACKSSQQDQERSHHPQHKLANIFA